MNNFFRKLALLAVAVFTIAGAAAQDADKILGVYKAVEEGKESKVEFTRQADGTADRLSGSNSPTTPTERPNWT